MRRGSPGLSVFFCTFVLAGGSAISTAQTTASIFGVVTDETGAVVAGARIQATNTLTNEIRRTTTNEIGNYSLPDLAVGVYSVRVESDGFKTAVFEGIELSLNRNARVNAQLSVGALAEQVKVTGDAPLIETTTNEMGGLVDQKRIVDLPLNGRNTLSLVSLVPGAANLVTGNAQGFQENKVAINGQRQEDSSWLLDGGNNTSPLRNYGNDVPNPDAIQEFRVITNNYEAQYGHVTGGVVNVVTRSGTNEFHGSRLRVPAKPFAKRPELLPGDDDRSRTEPVRRHGRRSGDQEIRPSSSAAFRPTGSEPPRSRIRRWCRPPRSVTAISPALTDVKGNLIAVNDPRTGRPFPGNIIPADRLSKVAQNYLKAATPLPNAPQLGVHGIQQSASAPSDSTQLMAKADHIFSERHKLTGAYFWNDHATGQRFLNSTRLDPAHAGRPRPERQPA